MVCVVSFFRNIFGHRKKTESAVLPPPPDYGEVCAQDNHERAEKAPASNVESALLNPNLHFTANDIEAHLATKDARFAAAVVELMVPRLQLGVWQEPVGWGHYSFTLDKQKAAGCHSDACQCNKATGWDNIIGFKAWEYASRFKQVSDLVKRDLELRGFTVNSIEVYTHKCNLKNCRGGVFVKWDVRLSAERSVGADQNVS